MAIGFAIDIQNNKVCRNVPFGPFRSVSAAGKGFLYRHLLLLVHSHKCRKPNNGTSGDICTIEQCVLGKKYLRHISLCSKGKSCPSQNCVPLKRLILHRWQCNGICRLCCEIPAHVKKWHFSIPLLVRYHQVKSLITYLKVLYGDLNENKLFQIRMSAKKFEKEVHKSVDSEAEYFDIMLRKLRQIRYEFSKPPPAA